ncbi:MAG: hypothetical protein ABIN01_18725 [Ferruginibacter sp.]
MDRNFHNDDFERLLREKSEEFRMYPSKRIWHSIYNNIHPARKWPSVTMGILLVTSLLLIGYLNTNNTSSLIEPSGKNVLKQTIADEINSSQTVFQKLSDYTINKFNTVKTLTSLNDKPNNKNASKDEDMNPSQITGSQLIVQQPSFTANTNVTNRHSQFNLINEFYHPLIDKINYLPVKINDPSQTTIESDHKVHSGESSMPGDDSKMRFPKTLESPTNDLAILDKRATVSIQNSIQNENDGLKKNVTTANKNLISLEDRSWIENYALYNRPGPKKWANKLAFQMYATPSVVYRILYNDLGFGNTLSTAPFAISPTNQNINYAVDQSPSVGFEIGTGLLYSIFKGVKIKGGLQLNYTRYNSHAFQNTHPVATRITMHDYETQTSYEEHRTTPYSNKTGPEPVNLHNETVQLSIPLGTDLKLIGNEKIQWNVGVTIQPTYVIAGKSYLISSDRRNYVKETSMLNKWNLNAGFETFLTYKTNGITLQLGPQFRTQLFSTNSKKIAVEERLLNYGLKFGMFKTIK